MVQFVRPASDSAAGSWTTTPLWSKIDEGATGDDTTIISADNTSPDDADFTTNSVTDPAKSTGHILRVAWNKEAAAGHQVDPELELYQGDPGGSGTLIAQITVTDIGATEQVDTHTLTGTEADNITDYTDLYLRLKRVGDTGGSPGSRRFLEVDYCELEVPDPFTPDLKAFRFYDDDGSESGSTASAAQDIDVSVAEGAVSHLRLRVDETAAGSGLTTDDYQLQYSKNSGAWANVTAFSANVRANADTAYRLEYAGTSTKTIGDPSNPIGMFFKDDGTKLFASRKVAGTIEEFSLTTAWDISTIGTADVTKSPTEPTGYDHIAFKTDGTKLYISDIGGDKVHQYALTGAWDLSTLAASSEKTLDVAAIGVDNIVGISFQPDGTSVFLMDLFDDTLSEHDLSTAWDISTAGSATNTFSPSEPDTPRGVTFNSDGTRVYIGDQTDDEVHQYSLSTPWDISTASALEVSFEVDPDVLVQQQIIWGDSGSKFYICSDLAAISFAQYELDLATQQLTEAAATTNRATEGISDGSGSFVAGQQDTEDGVILNHQLTASNFTEHVFALKIIAADVAPTDTLDFRLALNGGSPGMTNTVEPTITVVAAGGTTPKTITVTRTRTAVVSTVFTQPITIAVTRTRSIALVKQASKAFAVTRTRAAALVKQAGKTLSVTRTRAAALATVFTKPITIAVTRTRSAGIVKQASKALSVTRTRTIGLVKQASKAIAVTRTRTAALTTAFTQFITIAVTRTRTAVSAEIKLVIKVIAVTRTRTVALAKATARTLGVTRTRAIGLVKQAGKAFNVTRTRASALAKQTSKTLSVTRVRSVVVAGSKQVTKLIAVTRTRTAALSTSLTQFITIAVTRTRSSAIVKQTGKTFAVTRTRTAALATAFIQTITIAVTRTRTAVVDPTALLLKLITVTRTRTVALVKSTAKTLGLTRTRTTALTKQTAKTFTTTRTRAAATTRMTLLTFAVTRTRSVVVDIVKMATQLIAVTRTRAAAVTPVPTFMQAVNVTRTRTATLAKTVKKIFTVIRTRTTALGKKTLKTFSLTRTRTAVADAVLLAVQAISVTRTRTIAAAQVFIAGGPGGGPDFWRRFRAWRRHR